MNRAKLSLVAALLLSFVQAVAVPCPPGDEGPAGGDTKDTRTSQPWQFRPERRDDKLRSYAIHLVRDIGVTMRQRSAALSLTTPQKIQTIRYDDAGRQSGPNDLAFSQLLAHVNQGAIWASILLTVDPSLLSAELRNFRKDLNQHLQDYSKVDPATLQQSAEQAKHHKPSKKPNPGDAIDAEISYQALVSRMGNLFPGYARMYQYQSPRLLNRAGEPTMFALFDPMAVGVQPLNKGEVMVPVFIVQVTQVDRGRFQLEVYDAYREIWDWEGYVPRNPEKGAAAGLSFSLHNSPAFELNPREAYISRSPKEELTLNFASGSPVLTGTTSPIVRGSGALQRVKLPPDGFDPSHLTPGTASAGVQKESPTQTASLKSIAEAHASAAPSVPASPPPAPAAVPTVHVPTTKIAAIFRKDANLVLAGTAPTSDDQARIAKGVIDNWLAHYFLDATGPEADMLRKAMPNSNGVMSIYFSVSPAPANPKDPPNIITSRTASSLSVALPPEHYELPGNVLLDLVGVLSSNLPSQDKESGEAVKRSIGKFLANSNSNQPVPADALARLGVETASPGTFITADIPEHPTGALGIYNPEEQGMAYRVVDFFNLLLKEADYLQRAGHAREFETTQKLLAALPTGLVIHFSIQKEVDPGSRKRKEQPLPENSATDIYLSLPEHAYRPARDDFQILRDALAEAIAKSERPGGPTGPEISSLLDDFLRSYSSDPHNQNNILTEVIKSLYTTS